MKRFSKSNGLFEIKQLIQQCRINRVNVIGSEVAKQIIDFLQCAFNIPVVLKISYL